MSAVNKHLVFGKPSFSDLEVEALRSCIESGWIGTGPKVAEFESQFKDYLGAKHVLALNSCTAALHLALIASGVSKNDEVITTATTFCSTVNTIVHCGAKPVLIDINPETLNIDVNLIEEKISNKTKAIIIVHFAGRPCDMIKVKTLCDRYKIKLIEDCAHSIETMFDGKHVGLFGDFGCFSFYATKNICTGEGGALICKNENDFDMVKKLSLHGMNRDAWKRFSDEGYSHYDVDYAGYKYNMMDIQAAIGLCQLKKINNIIKIRKKIWLHYEAEFKNLPFKYFSSEVRNGVHAHHLFTIQIDNNFIERDKALRLFNENKIGVGVHYRSIIDHSFYKNNYDFVRDEFKNSLSYGDNTISLPLSNSMTDSDVERSVAITKKIFKA